MGREVDLSLQIYMGYKTIVSAFDRYTYWSFKRKLTLVLLPIYYVFCLYTNYTCTYNDTCEKVEI